jgi:hypothetical protein
LRAKPGLGQSPKVELDLRGHPLHTRAITVTLCQHDGGRLRAAGELVDVRKHGFVPVGGDLQASGVIHHMRVDAVVERQTLELREVGVEQPTVPFSPSTVTGGESCRDPAGRLRALVGRRLDASFASRLNAEIGGPRGCTHVLTLAQLLASTLPWACDRERELCAGSPAPGERIFRRDLVFDGALGASSRIGLAAQLGDLHFRPGPERAGPMERLAAQLELRLLAEVDLESMTLEGLRGARRRRGPSDLERAAWESPGPDLAGLRGLPLRPGVSGTLLRRFGERPDERPLLAALLNLTPAFYQCLATVSDDVVLREALEPTVVGLGGRPDSCYMWRRGGALDRSRS